MALLRQLFELGVRPSQPSVGSAGESRNHLQIAGQFFEGGSRRDFRLRFTLELQKQLRLFEEPLPELGGGPPPGGIQLAGLPAAELVSRKGDGHLLAVVQADTSHRY
jgi:hypothetical protein